MLNTLDDTINRIQPLDTKSMLKARARQETLTKPSGSLGKLEELSIQIAGIQAKSRPRLTRKAVVVMVADHGVATEGTSAYPQEVTTQMLLNFVRGGAAISVICRQTGAKVVVVDIGIAGDTSSFKGILHKKISPGTRNMCLEQAMTIDQARRSIETGIRVIQTEVNKGLDIVGTGEMGIGNTTASSAICATFTKRKVSEVTGRGTGLTDEMLQRKIAVIEKAINVNRPCSEKPMEVLAKVGGYEIGGLAGVILGAAANRVPAVIDGFISGAAALIATGLCPRVRDYLIPGHLSIEPGHKYLLDFLGLKPVLDLNMRLGEGTGAALAMMIADSACLTLSEMATFTEAGVSNKV